MICTARYGDGTVEKWLAAKCPKCGQTVTLDSVAVDAFGTFVHPRCLAQGAAVASGLCCAFAARQCSSF